MVLYRILHVLFPAFFRLFGAKDYGAENMPPEGGVIVAANHMSNWDPPFLASFLERPVSYMAKQELFEIPIFGTVIRWLFAFPVRRGAADRSAVKAAVKELRAGRCVGIFPEGTRSKDGEVHHFGAGVALLASMSGAPVVPAAIVGTDKMRNLRVVYGAPISFEGKANRETLDEFSQKIREEVIKMKKACEEPEA
ncbi:MAG: 1-acyl-sn-glycerol-3-phosphate acyltransferase [Schwartzia sp.]|nr:1-acyl-sn-glycerol-3-phosphate acyltransferase [Schwartzia sp. (in: firmicutes)]